MNHSDIHGSIGGCRDTLTCLSGFPKHKIMKHRLYYFPMLLMFVVAAPAFGAEVGSQPPTCEDSAIVASAVRTEEDVRVFVQCAYEYAQKEGLEEARRAFNQDARWKSGPIYVFISEVDAVERSGSSFHLSACSGEGRIFAWTADRRLRQRLLQGTTSDREPIR